jgi:hypothetical protein
MVEQSFLPRVGVINIEHVISKVFITVEGIEVSQEIYYFTFVFIIRHKVLHKFLKITPKLWKTARVYNTSHWRTQILDPIKSKFS